MNVICQSRRATFASHTIFLTHSCNSVGAVHNMKTQFLLSM